MTPKIKQKKLRWSIVIAFMMFNIITSALFFYLNSLDTDVYGNHFSLLFNTVFRDETVSIIGAIAIIGWGAFVFYLLQVTVAVMKNRSHRSF